MKPSTVVIVDDQKLFSHGLVWILEDFTEFKVIGQAHDGMEAVRLCERLFPDIVIIDISMPKLNGIEAVKRIKSIDPDIKIIVCSVHDDEDIVAQVLNLGISGYVLKTAASDDLIDALNVVLKGKTYLSPDISSIVLQMIRSPGEFKNRESLLDKLTRKERHILQLVSEGKSSKEIGSLLNVSIHTVKTHRYNIMNKLNIHSIAELTRFAIENKLSANQTI